MTWPAESFDAISAAAERSEALPTVEPVFVLCMGRSGSTLLRFLLDAHPDLACPPETSLPAICGQLAVVWSLIEGAPLSQTRGDTPPVVPAGAVAGIRQTVDTMIGAYLMRRSKRRFCDKSLGSARFADLLVQVFPGAKFLCLYRYPMDMIRSGLEASPWGVAGYGFDTYIADSPGNAVLALARYWLDNASLIAAVEERYPDRCHRVRYEDMVTAAEDVAGDLFGFLGVPAVPGLTERCFSDDRERFGPSDHKIWGTSRISDDSVGKGETIPAWLIPGPVLAAINDLAGKLGYCQVDDSWGAPGQTTDPRMPGSSRYLPRDAIAPAGEGAGDTTLLAAERLLQERARAGAASADDRFARQWGAYATETFLLVSRRPAGRGTGGEVRWLVNLAERTVTSCAEDDPEEARWNVLGTAETWRAILRGELNFYTALRRYEVRYCDPGDAGPLDAEKRTAMLTDLLGIGSWAAAGGYAPGGSPDQPSTGF